MNWWIGYKKAEKKSKKKAKKREKARRKAKKKKEEEVAAKQSKRNPYHVFDDDDDDDDDDEDNNLHINIINTKKLKLKPGKKRKTNFLIKKLFLAHHTTPAHQHTTHQHIFCPKRFSFSSVLVFWFWYSNVVIVFVQYYIFWIIHMCSVVRKFGFAF